MQPVGRGRDHKPRGNARSLGKNGLDLEKSRGLATDQRARAACRAGERYDQVVSRAGSLAGHETGQPAGERLGSLGIDPCGASAADQLEETSQPAGERPLGERAGLGDLLRQLASQGLAARLRRVEHRLEHSLEHVRLAAQRAQQFPVARAIAHRPRDHAVERLDAEGVARVLGREPASSLGEGQTLSPDPFQMGREPTA